MRDGWAYIMLEGVADQWCLPFRGKRLAPMGVRRWYLSLWPVVSVPLAQDPQQNTEVQESGCDPKHTF
jgi:hypothetical protein